MKFATYNPFMFFYFVLVFPQLSFALPTEDINELAEAIIQSLPGATSRSENSDSQVNEIEIHMRVPAKALPNILEKGFQNQHQTFSTKGMFDPSLRQAAEGIILYGECCRLGAIQITPISTLHPKYGYLDYSTRSSEARHYPENNLDQYGELDIVFKSNDPHLVSRTTYSFFDSLAGAKMFPLSNLDPLEEFQRGTPLSSPDYWTSGNTNNREPRSWNLYLEAQIWGSLELTDVKEIRLIKDVDESTLDLLKRISESYGIPVYKNTEKVHEQQRHLEPQYTKSLLYQPESLHSITLSSLSELQRERAEQLLKNLPEPLKNEGISPEDVPWRLKEKVSVDLAEKGYYSVPHLPILEQAIQTASNKNRNLLLKILFSTSASPRAKAKASILLAHENWPLPPLEFESLEKVVNVMTTHEIMGHLKIHHQTSESLAKGLFQAGAQIDSLKSKWEASFKSCEPTDVVFSKRVQPDSERSSTLESQSQSESTCLP